MDITTIRNMIMAAGAGLIILVAAVLAVSPALAEGYQVDHLGRVTNVEHWDHLNVRKWPASHSQKIGHIAPDGYLWIERCMTVENSSDWCKVAHGPLFGWVNSRYLALIPH